MSNPRNRFPSPSLLIAVFLITAVSAEQTSRAQEITITRINLDQTTLRHLSTGQFIPGNQKGKPAGTDKTSVFQTLRDLYPNFVSDINGPVPPRDIDSAKANRNTDNSGFFPVETNSEGVEHALGHLINTDLFIDAVVVVPDPNPGVNGTIEVLRNLGNDPGGWLGLETHIILTVGRQPSGVTIGDLNGDGQPDIAVSNKGDGNIMIFFNDPAGTGSFGAPTVILLDEGGGERPLSIAAADFTGDSLIDLVVGSGGTNTITLLTNTPGPLLQAGPGFPRTQEIAVGSNPVTICPIDTDNDKDLDIVVVNSGSNTVSILKNQPPPPPGILMHPFDQLAVRTLLVGHGPQDISEGLIDGDLFPDIVISNADGTITIILNDGLTLNNSIPDIDLGLYALSVDFGDFDNDGDSDLSIVANAPSDDPILIDPKFVPLPGKPQQELAGDPTVYAPAVLLIENLGSLAGTIDLADPLNFKVPGEPKFIVNADFNNDTITDFFTTNRIPAGGNTTVKLIPPNVFVPPPPPPPATGACCSPNGSCLIDTLASCLAGGGLFQGVDVPCTPNPCPQPATGACCLPDKSCLLLSESECQAQGGYYRGNGTDCASFNCDAGPPPPSNNSYDSSNAVGTPALGFFLIFDPSLPGAPDDVVNFDGIPEDTRTDVNGTVVTLNETNVPGVGTTHTITITATSPVGTDMFPLVTGFPGALTDGAIFLGTVDRIDTDPGSIVDSSILEFFTNGISVAGPFDVAGIISNADGVWEGNMGVSIGGLAGFGVNGWTLTTTFTVDLNGCTQGPCPTDIDPPGGDGITNDSDLIAALNNFGAFGPPRPLGDVAPPCGDWEVRIEDIILISNSFGPCPFVPGDLCADAIVVVDGANAFDNTGFLETLAPGVNQCEFADPQLDDIWFVWSAPAAANNLNVTADLCGTLFDAAMSVFPNDCLLTTDSANALGCGDDNAIACAATFEPEVSWVATPGFSYILVASGWQGGGSGTLNITSAEITNDDCPGALPLVVNAAFISGNNTGALTESPAAADCGPATDGLSTGSAPLQADGGTWFSVIGTGNILKANTCNPTQFSFYPTFVNVYCGGCALQFCIGDSNLIACGFGPYAEIDWCSALGEEYLILIHGQDLAGGAETFSLRVEDALVPCANPGSCNLPGDTCATAQTMTIVPGAGPSGEPQGVFAVDNTLMNTTIPPNVGNCGGLPGDVGGSGTQGGKDFWITYTATTTGNARLDTCGADFDTIINLWQFPPGGECELINANIVVCNDDFNNGGSDTCFEPNVNPFPSSVEIHITAGTVYHVSVSEWGIGGSGGLCQFRVIENFVASGACQVGGVCTEGVTAASCAASCGDYFIGATCIDVPTGACCLGGACLGISSRQACGANGSTARFTEGAITCVGVDCSDSCVAAVASNGPFNGLNGIRPSVGFNVLGAGDDFTLDAPAVLNSLQLGMIYNVVGNIASGAIQYEITIYELGTPGVVGSACDAPTIADLVSSTSIPVYGPTVMTGVTLTVGGPAFGGHHEIVEGTLTGGASLTAGRYFMVVRILDDPLNMFWGTANGAADGSAGESAIFGTDNTAPPPVDANTEDGQRDHAFCIN